jgi:peptidoglycan/LPS O-acetylase OafA/YrhL
MIQSRFDALTGFRALAASMVFIYHNRKYWRAQLHPEVLRLLNEFHVGVALFFVLSGFLLAYGYGDKPAQSFGEYKRYIIGRMARIFPLYWLVLTLYYLDPRFGKMDFSILTYTLTHGFSNKMNLEGIAQAWSLSVEFTFYLLLPFLCLMERKKIVYLVLFLLSITLLTWLSGYVWFWLNGNPHQFFYPLKFVLGSTFFGRWTEFFAGIVLARMLKQSQDKYAWFWQWKYKTYTGIFGVFVLCYVVGLFQPDVFHHGTDHPVGYLIFALIIPLFVLLWLAGLISEPTLVQRFFSSKILILLGKASFAFYLIHISYVNIRLKWIWLGPDRNFVLLWLVSILLYLLFENPVNSFIKDKFLKKPER